MAARALPRTSHHWPRRGIVLVLATLLSLALTGCEPPKTNTGSKSTSTTTKGRTTTRTQTGATLQITTSKKTCWSGQIGATTKHGCGSATIRLKSSKGSYTVNLHKTKGPDGLIVVLVVNGKKVDSGRSSSTSVVTVTQTSS
jgi:hypothetical protein